jgi:UDP-glucuronate 4-epimerase
MKTVLITGVAGFIGYHVAKRCIAAGFNVVGLDNINNYYDPSLKLARLKSLGVTDLEHGDTCSKNFSFFRVDILDRKSMDLLFDDIKFDYVINLAAQVGVRYSLKNPRSYIQSNIEGFLNILEGCRQQNVEHLIYASSSSVYGMNSKIPFSTEDQVDHPVSLYAATKRSNELMAHSYSHLYNIPSTGLRFFTVYGPWGRPDMAPFIFARAILQGTPLKVFNNGEMYRDFTYIDDIVESIFRLIDKIPKRKEENFNHPDCSDAPFRILNIGNSSPVKLLYFIKELELAIGKKAIMEMHPIQPGDVYRTWADVDKLISLVDYKPSVPIKEGVGKFISWYKSYFEHSCVLKSRGKDKDRFDEHISG